MEIFQVQRGRLSKLGASLMGFSGTAVFSFGAKSKSLVDSEDDRSDHPSKIPILKVVG